MPRPLTRPRFRERRPEQRPPEILEAALQVFLAKGYQATRLEEVAAAAGVTKGAIYHYFEGKDDLLTQAVRARFLTGFDDVEAQVRRSGGPASARLRLGLRRVWRIWCEPEWSRLFALLVGELRGQFPALVETFLDSGPRRGWRVVERLLEEGKAAGEFRADLDTRIAARFVVSGLVQQILLQSLFHLEADEAFDADRIFDSTVEIWFRGLQPTARAAT